MARPDLAANLEPTDKAYVTACQREERAGSWRRIRAATAVMVLLLSVGGATATYARWFPVVDAAAHRLINMRGDLSKAGQVFRDCLSCPEMVVIPAGSFMMGSPESDRDARAHERPQRKITIGQAFAVAKFEVTFEQWDICFLAGACTEKGGDQGWGRGNRPAINVSWDDAQQYLKWLSGVTRQTFRLLTEAEWEYAARGGKTTRFSWGDDPGENNANCDVCKSQWDNKQTAPIGSFKPNDFGLYDMHGNVWEWVHDCYDEKAYASAPKDGTPAKEPVKCGYRVLRGGSWANLPGYLAAAFRSSTEPVNRTDVIGFRVARVLSPASP